MAIWPDVEAFEFGPWTAADVIVGPASVPYLEDDDPADFTGATVQDGKLIHPAGIYVPATATVNGTDSAVLDYLLSGDPFTVPGVYGLSASLVVNGNTVRINPALFVVEAGDGWATLAEARADWRDAPASDVKLWRLLDMARVQVLSWAPATAPPAEPVPPPSNYVTAQLTQARNIWNAVKADPASQGIGDEGFLIRPFPLDWTVKNMIRPPSAKPVVA